MWTAEGRRALSPIQLPAPAAFLAAAAPHQLLVVSCSGQLMQWHVHRRACVLQESVQPVLAAATAANTTVRHIRLSKAGLPLAVLGNRTTLGFDSSMRCWLRLADDAFVGSAFASAYTLGTAGPGAELAAMQVSTLTRVEEEAALFFSSLLLGRRRDEPRCCAVLPQLLVVVGTTHGLLCGPRLITVLAIGTSRAPPCRTHAHARGRGMCVYVYAHTGGGVAGSRTAAAERAGGRGRAGPACVDTSVSGAASSSATLSPAPDSWVFTCPLTRALPADPSEQGAGYVPCMHASTAAGSAY